jgi:2'-5' RNA ligase
MADVAVVPASANYRPATDPARQCSTCRAFAAGVCTMFPGDPPVSPSYVCDDWEAKPEQLNLPPAAPGAKHHNAVLAAARVRVDELEDQLVAVLTPMLRRAGQQAAANFRKHATNHLTAAGPLSGVNATSTMICVRPRPAEAALIADPDGAPASDLHCTLVFLGEIDGPLDAVASALQPVSAAHGPLAGVVGGYGEFRPPGCGILLPDVPGLVELRCAVTEALVAAGIDYSRAHGYQPHITVDGSPEPGEAEEMLERAAGQPLHFDEILLVRGDEDQQAFPLVGPKPVTADGQPRLPDWTPPAIDELIDGDALAAQFRGKTDPVRLALIHEVLGASLAGAGLSFDVSNPLIDGLLAQTGKHITSIVDTTRANVMRVIGSSYQAGLSIPDTAQAIQTVMTDAAPVRAVMIARTEMASAVNGASLLAANAVSKATGKPMTKTWLTAPGARYPRHEDYDDLDGQTVSQNGTFQVGNDQLQYPGDPNGSPEEVINCRCAMTYSDGEEVDADS